MAGRHVQFEPTIFELLSFTTPLNIHERYVIV